MGRLLSRRSVLRGAGLGLASLSVPFDARFIEPYSLEVTRHEVPLPTLPLEFDGFTIAHLTDLHRGHLTPDSVIRDAVAAANAERPDLVVVTGDFIEGATEDALPVAQMLAPLRPSHGLWGSMGNHDYNGSGRFLAQTLESEAGLRMLTNAATPVAPGFWLAGLDDTLRGHPDPGAATQRIPADAAALFLTHNPVGVYPCAGRPWLALAGHTHGGQIRIPGMRPKLPPGMEGFPYAAGWGLFERTRLYISRGIGVTHVPLRFRCPPEVALFTLRRGDAPPTTHRGLAVRAFDKAGRVAKKVARHAGDAWRRAI